MNLKTVKSLLKLISDTDVNEVEIEEGEFKIRVKKQPDTIHRAETAPMYQGSPAAVGYQMPGADAPQQQAPAPQTQSPPPAEDSNKEDDNLLTVRSPIVGTFYRSPSPESEPFINIGDTVATGDVLCIVEAMKIMNEIEAEHSGKVVKLLVDDGQPVEFDQPLFLIQPS